MSIRKIREKVASSLIMAAAVVIPSAVIADPPVGGHSRNRLAIESAGPIAVKVATDKKTYAVGDSIVLTMTVRNTTKSSQQLDFSSGEKYDFEIRKGTAPDGALVWQWSRGMMFTQMVTRVPIQAGATQTYSTTFSSRDHASALAPVTLTPGAYTVIGTLTTMPRTARPFGTTTFTVK